mmetsp:Transcript_20730/g.40030  ORF Transcript_20730/g.40030 Transcript_20730/m.40030 type:complete len:289 (-) Transcript_20730:3235-4101(-)
MISDVLLQFFEALCVLGDFEKEVLRICHRAVAGAVPFVRSFRVLTWVPWVHCLVTKMLQYEPEAVLLHLHSVGVVEERQIFQHHLYHGLHEDLAKHVFPIVLFRDVIEDVRYRGTVVHQGLDVFFRHSADEVLHHVANLSEGLRDSRVFGILRANHHPWGLAFLGLALGVLNRNKSWGDSELELSPHRTCLQGRTQQQPLHRCRCHELAVVLRGLVVIAQNQLQQDKETAEVAPIVCIIHGRDQIHESLLLVHQLSWGQKSYRFLPTLLCRLVDFGEELYRSHVDACD